jgi:septal ring factor EnvC (AmiA/AmiB activator)
MFSRLVQKNSKELKQVKHLKEDIRKAESTIAQSVNVNDSTVMKLSELYFALKKASDEQENHSKSLQYKYNVALNEVNYFMKKRKKDLKKDIKDYCQRMMEMESECLNSLECLQIKL